MDTAVPLNAWTEYKPLERLLQAAKDESSSFWKGFTEKSDPEYEPRTGWVGQVVDRPFIVE